MTRSWLLGKVMSHGRFTLLLDRATTRLVFKRAEGAGAPETRRTNGGGARDVTE